MLKRYGGARIELRFRREATHVEFILSETGDNSIRRVPLYRDKLSGMDTFFTQLPIEYVHHDNQINPRSIGAK
jgi:hypothetical protein